MAILSFFSLRPLRLCGLILAVLLGDLGNLARSDAAGADSNPAPRTIDHGVNTLKVGQPTPLGQVVSVAHPMATHGPLATDFTNSCHDL